MEGSNMERLMNMFKIIECLLAALASASLLLAVIYKEARLLFLAMIVAAIIGVIVYNMKKAEKEE